MSFLIPVALYGWIPFSIYLFTKFESRKAILITLVAGYLFLPGFSYYWPLLRFGRNLTIFLGIIIGLANKNLIEEYKYDPMDFFMITFFSISPLFSSLLNGLGLYDGLTNISYMFFDWGGFYFIGRIYLGDRDGISKLVNAIIIGGLIYVPLCLYEIRMSPQLNVKLYGFYPHSFLQHIRYGGYRPMVFMGHGLKVSLWLAMSFLATFWLFHIGGIKKIGKIPLGISSIILLTTTYLSKSKGAFVFALISFLIAFMFKNKKLISFIFKLIIISIPAYLYIRLNGIITSDAILQFMSTFFDSDRISSLYARLYQEDIYSKRTLLRLFWGWGGWGRNIPIDPITGYKMGVVDSMWVIVSSKLGLIGLISVFAGMLAGPWKVLMNLRKYNFPIEAIILSVIVIFFMIDCLSNYMFNPIYVVFSGSLAGLYINEKRNGLANE